jgi:hypothetical protein
MLLICEETWVSVAAGDVLYESNICSVTPGASRCMAGVPTVGNWEQMRGSGVAPEVFVYLLIAGPSLLA